MSSLLRQVSIKLAKLEVSFVQPCNYYYSHLYISDCCYNLDTNKHSLLTFPVLTHAPFTTSGLDMLIKMDHNLSNYVFCFHISQISTTILMNTFTSDRTSELNLENILYFWYFKP